MIKFDENRIDHFSDLIVKEIQNKEFENSLRSIYFGGGTPYLLGPENIFKILKHCPKATEVTLEANPEDVTFESMKAFKKAGINRVSIGIQSFDDDLLKLLGRNHSSQKARQAILDTVKAGIDNITIDLMYDVPTQTRATFQKTLEICKQMPITHLSLYNLTIEPFTPFHKKQKSLEILRPSSRESTEMLSDAINALEEMGLNRYEISAFAKPGFESLHNTGYWEGIPFHGVGPSAFSYIDGARFQNVCNMKKYEDKVLQGIDPRDFYEKLEAQAAQRELLMTGIRMVKGVEKSRFKKVLKSKDEEIKSLINDGFLKETEQRLLLTKKGQLFFDDVACELI